MPSTRRLRSLRSNNGGTPFNYNKFIVSVCPVVKIKDFQFVFDKSAAPGQAALQQLHIPRTDCQWQPLRRETYNCALCILHCALSRQILIYAVVCGRYHRIPEMPIMIMIIIKIIILIIILIITLRMRFFASCGRIKMCRTCSKVTTECS